MSEALSDEVDELEDITGVGSSVSDTLKSNGVDSVETFRRVCLGEDVDGVYTYFDPVRMLEDRFVVEACADVGLLYTGAEPNQSASEFTADNVESLRVLGYDIQSIVEETSLSWDDVDAPRASPYVTGQQVMEVVSVGDRISLRSDQLDGTVMDVDKDEEQITVRMDNGEYDGALLTLTAGWQVVDQPDDMKDLSRYTYSITLLPTEDD